MVSVHAPIRHACQDHMGGDFSYSLWSKIVATLQTTSKIFLSEFQNCQKSTQALSVYRKGTVCIYNECLIVASHKVTIKRRGGEKGHSCCTSLSTTWSLVTPLMHHQRMKKSWYNWLWRPTRTTHNTS